MNNNQDLITSIHFNAYSLKESQVKLVCGMEIPMNDFLNNRKPDYILSKINNIWYLTFTTKNETVFDILNNAINDPDIIFSLEISSHVYSNLQFNHDGYFKLDLCYPIYNILKKEEKSLLIEICQLTEMYTSDLDKNNILILNLKYDPNSNTEIQHFSRN